PFYLHELLEALLERGVVVTEGERLAWMKREAGLQVPTTGGQVVSSRIDGRPPNEKGTRLRAPVSGPRIGPADLSTLLGRDARPELERLAERGLFDRDGKGGYAFHNQIIFEVVYAGLAEGERRALHHKAAQLLAAAERPHPEVDAVLAAHAAAAGDRDEAI